MKEYTIAELPPELLLIGTEEDREKFLPAIIGIAKDKSRLAYSWDLLVKCFMEAWGVEWEEAAAHVEQNVEGSLYSYGPHAPVLLEQTKLTTRNKEYDPIKIKK